MDSWLQFTKWKTVLSNSKHNILERYKFLRYPRPDEPELERILFAWEHTRIRALDTLENADYKMLSNGGYLQNKIKNRKKLKRLLARIHLSYHKAQELSTDTTEYRSNLFVIRFVQFQLSLVEKVRLKSSILKSSRKLHKQFRAL